MCLVAVAWRASERFPLVLAANRDEFLARPAAPMGWWAGSVPILAGRDLEAGGTWLGTRADGRWAALTNYRDPALHRAGAASRGGIVPRVLADPAPLGDAVHAAAAAGAAANPYNLLAGDDHGLYYYSSVTGEVRPLAPGLHLLSNHLLGTPWPKVRRIAAGWAVAHAQLPALSGLQQLFADDQLAEDHELPRTGIPPEWERNLSAVHIRAPGYGTRCLTIGLHRRDGPTLWHERSFGPAGEVTGEVQFAVE